MAVAIDEIVRNGILFDLKNWQNVMPNGDKFFQIIENLFDTLSERKINYLLVGWVALLSYVQGRNTQDIDLVLARSDLEALPEIVVSEENPDFLRGELNGLQIEILLTQNPLFEKIIQQFATTRQFGDRSKQVGENKHNMGRAGFEHDKLVFVKRYR